MHIRTYNHLDTYMKVLIYTNKWVDIYGYRQPEVQVIMGEM